VLLLVAELQLVRLLVELERDDAERAERLLGSLRRRRDPEAQHLTAAVAVLDGLELVGRLPRGRAVPLVRQRVPGAPGSARSAGRAAAGSRHRLRPGRGIGPVEQP